MKIPSYKAAVLAGAFAMPALLKTGELIESSYKIESVSFLFGILGMAVAVLAVTDINVMKKLLKEKRYIIKLGWDEDVIREFYVPTWKRMFVWFASVVASDLVTKALTAYLIYNK